MRINNNMLAQNTHRQMGIAGGNQAKAMEKLSSGLRINRAGDDAAGLSISEKMRGQIRGLNQASKNAQDGISMVQTAEGALSETHAILQRMRELSVQSSNDTNVDTLDREAIQNEFTKLKEEVDRIGNTTEFNTQKLIDGSVGAKKLTGKDNAAIIGESVGKSTGASVTTAATSTGTTYSGTSATFQIDGANITINHEASDYTAFDDGTNVDSKGLAEKLQKDINEAIDAYNTANDKDIKHITVETSANQDGTITFKSGSTGVASTVGIVSGNTGTTNFAEEILGQTADTVASGTGLEGTYTAGGAGAVKAVSSLTGNDAKTSFVIDGKEISIDFDYNGLDNEGKATNSIKTAAGSAAVNGDMSSVATALQNDLNAAISNYNKSVPTSEQVKDVTVSIKDGSFVVESGSDKSTSSVKFDNSEASQLLGLANKSSATQGGGVDFQIGANQGQTMKITIEDMRADALGISNINLGSAEGAREAITTINDAINSVSNQRSELGAFQNRLEHSIKNLDNSAENLQAAESRIRDVDMAKEMMNLSKQNILQQASQAMMSQANQSTQGVLQLLR